MPQNSENNPTQKPKTKMSNTTARARAKAAVIKNEEDLNQAVVKAAGLKLEHDKITLLIEERLRVIKEDLSTKAEALKKESEAEVKRIQKYAAAHREELFGDKQSVTIAGHALEFRRSPGRTSTLKGYTVQDVVDALLSIDDEALSEKMTSVKASLSKDDVLDYWETGEEAQDFLRSIGVEVVKDESFKFTPSSSGPTGGSIAGEKEAPDA